MIYFTADNHFGHKNIIKYTNRPFKTTHGMNKTMIGKWNAVVSPTDSVFHLGDFCFPKYIDPEELIKKLNGTIYLIKGNHDPKKTCLAIKKVLHNKKLRIGRYNCLLSHRPNLGERANKYDYVICGHVHNAWKKRDKYINVGVDVRNFTPISMLALERELNEYSSTPSG